MKRLLCFILLLSTIASAQTGVQNDLVGILFKGRVEYYWVLYRSPDGQQTKLSNYHTSIDFFIDTAHLNSIIVERPFQLQYRVIRVSRT